MVILIIDSSIDIIERLEELLGETKNVRSIYTAVSQENAAMLYTSQQPDAVLLDIGFNDSLQLLKTIKTTGNNTAVVMIYIQEDTYKAEKCRSLGADFFCDLYHDYGKIPGIINTIATNKNKNVHLK